MENIKLKNSGRIWTKKEDETLAEIIVSLVNQGKKYREAYSEASKLLGRSEYSIDKRWHKHLKPKNISKINKSLQMNMKLEQPSKGTTATVKNNTVEDTLKELQNSKEPADIKKEIGQEKKSYYEGRKKATPTNGVTKLAALCKSVETFESENFKILDSGKEGLEYIVINNEEDKGYLVKVDSDKVVSCNCPHHVYRQINGKGVICKHMLKIAFDKNLEVF